MEIVKRWIMKADNDLKLAIKELNSGDPITDMICFHCQQAVEKYLKAFLVSKNKEFRKTHDISELIKLCVDLDNDFTNLHELDIDDLTIYATELRYPEYFYIPSIEEAKKSVDIAKLVKEFVLNRLEGL